MKVCNVPNLNGSTASYHPPPLPPHAGLCSVSALLTCCTRNRCTTTCSLILYLPLLGPFVLLPHWQRSISPLDHCVGWGWLHERRLPRGPTHACPHPHNLWPPVCFPVSPSEHRCVESAKIRNKYPDRVPVSEQSGGWGATHFSPLVSTAIFGYFPFPSSPSSTVFDFPLYAQHSVELQPQCACLRKKAYYLVLMFSHQCLQQVSEHTKQWFTL